jgi:protein-tyrosine phosphatase
MDFNQVLPQVLVGSCPQSTDDIDWLTRDHAITAVLNLQTDEDLQYWQIDWRELKGHYQTSGVSVRRVPVTDFDVDDLSDKLPRCVNTLDDLLTEGHKVYVHCNAGINRSPSTVVAYLHWIQKRPLEDALIHVLRCRACEPYLDAIRNSAGLE